MLQRSQTQDDAEDEGPTDMFGLHNITKALWDLGQIDPDAFNNTKETQDNTTKGRRMRGETQT